jgi:hypothetical protein
VQYPAADGADGGVVEVAGEHLEPRRVRDGVIVDERDPRRRRPGDPGGDRADDGLSLDDDDLGRMVCLGSHGVLTTC